MEHRLARILVLTAGSLSLAGCGGFSGPGADGNPNRIPYAGQPGSAYVADANPPQPSGPVAYDPYAPLPDRPYGAAGYSSPQRPPGPQPD